MFETLFKCSRVKVMLIQLPQKHQRGQDALSCPQRSKLRMSTRPHCGGCGIWIFTVTVVWPPVARVVCWGSELRRFEDGFTAMRTASSLI